MAKVLVVGGAGYVGGSTCAWLLDQGHEPWILDDLSTGHERHVEALGLGSRFTRARAGDRAAVAELLSTQRFDCAMHFAARSLVAESVERPELYRENNVDQTRALIESLLEGGVRRFIFSSSCAVFGDPGLESIPEDAPRKPLNPYGETKLEVERMLERLAAERGLQSVALRYFNAAGAEPGLRVGEWHEPETHLIPRVLKAGLTGERPEIYGTDYGTPDGSCVRDYVHVRDLAAAHGAAMMRLLREGPATPGRFEAFNLGSEKGSSVREVIEACGRALGRPLAPLERPRRAGDPPFLVADSRRAQSELGFRASEPLDAIIASAWAWERKRRASLGKAVFLDRDGTINEDPGYLRDPAQLKLLPGVADALARLRSAGYRLVVVSNQSGVNRGLIQSETLPLIHRRLDELLVAAGGVALDRYELCLHRPDEGCECRKPKPKLLIDGARALGIDLWQSWMVGDKVSDVDAGRAADCRGSILVRTGAGRESEAAGAGARAAWVADSLAEAARWILERGENG